MILSKRITIIYDLPLQKGMEILRPETVILRFPNRKTTDVGALCYLHREPPPQPGQRIRRPSEGRLVDLQSFTKKRAEQIRTLIFHISDELEKSGLRFETVRDHTTRFVAFMSWADANDCHDVLNNAESARQALVLYIAHIRERVVASSISLNSGSRQQYVVSNYLERFLEVENLSRGINLLSKSPSEIECTVPPNENNQSRVLCLCEALFNGISALTLEGKSYPHPITLPKYLDYPNDTLWVFPSLSWFMSSKMQADRLTKWYQCSGYNYREGRLSTLDEIKSLKSGVSAKSNYKLLLLLASRQIHSANNNLRHAQRRHLGMIALNTFILIFLAQTGMNWAQLINLPWNDDYDVSATHQAFRTIKWRAHGRIVSFELPVAFLPKFKRFLELRKYLLDNRTCDLLFFKLGNKGTGDPVQIKTGPLSTYRTLQRIDPDLLVIKPREWRAAKSDWLIRNADPSTAALILQNSERTILASYAAGSETVHLEELSSFLDKVSETVIEKGKITHGEVSRATGICSAYGSPRNIAAWVPIQPDCKGQEGCLFCEKFRVHADEIDTRKLISFRYCLQQTSHLASSEEIYQSTLTPIFKRIESILADISSRDEAMVIRVTKEVEEQGELESYWAQKLEMLLELEVIL